MQLLFDTKSYCYFAVDRLDNGAFVGFTGLADPSFEADFLPAVDMGWRLAREEWFKGYATEGAKACLDHAFSRLKLERVIAIAPAINERSIAVMEKIGMQKKGIFQHPLLVNDTRLQDCVLYEALQAQP